MKEEEKEVITKFLMGWILLYGSKMTQAYDGDANYNELYDAVDKNTHKYDFNLKEMGLMQQCKGADHDLWGITPAGIEFIRTGGNNYD